MKFLIKNCGICIYTIYILYTLYRFIFLLIWYFVSSAKSRKYSNFCNYWGFHKYWDDKPQYAENCKIPSSVLKEDPVTSFLLISVFYQFFKNKRRHNHKIVIIINIFQKVLFGMFCIHNSFEQCQRNVWVYNSYFTVQLITRLLLFLSSLQSKTPLCMQITCQEWIQIHIHIL